MISDSLVVHESAPRDHIPNMSSAGLFAITREGLSTHGHLRDFGSSALPAAARNNDPFAFITSHYLKDTGTPTRLEAAQGDVDRGAFTRRGDRTARPALFLDRDGVINPTEPEFYEPSQYEVLPGVAQAIHVANMAGIPVVIVTNQPAIAKGFMTHDDNQRIRAKMDRLLGVAGAFVDDYLFCARHPEAGWVGEVEYLKVPFECRKPDIDMARQAAARHRLDLTRSAMVGDSDRDRGVARAAGSRFIHVSAPHERYEEEDCFPEAADAIRRGIEVVAC